VTPHLAAAGQAHVCTSPTSATAGPTSSAKLLDEHAAESSGGAPGIRSSLEPSRRSWFAVLLGVANPPPDLVVVRPPIAPIHSGAHAEDPGRPCRRSFGRRAGVAQGRVDAPGGHLLPPRTRRRTRRVRAGRARTLSTWAAIREGSRRSGTGRDLGQPPKRPAKRTCSSVVVRCQGVARPPRYPDRHLHSIIRRLLLPAMRAPLDLGTPWPRRPPSGWPTARGRRRPVSSRPRAFAPCPDRYSRLPPRPPPRAAGQVHQVDRHGRIRPRCTTGLRILLDAPRPSSGGTRAMLRPGTPGRRRTAPTVGTSSGDHPLSLANPGDRPGGQPGHLHEEPLDARHAPPTQVRPMIPSLWLTSPRSVQRVVGHQVRTHPQALL